MKTLDNITLFSVDCKFCERTIIAMQECLRFFKFKRVIFLSDKEPVNLDDRIEFIKIDTINNLNEYSKFVIFQLPDYIDTEFGMSVHHDGWVINPDKWCDEFLNYDYIGAPWPINWIAPNIRVGNGGVSIRSKKLMEIAKQHAPNINYNEDALICHILNDTLTSKGITFAPVELAKKFSVELNCEDLSVNLDEVFAFHGKTHSPLHLKHIKYLEGLYYRDVVTKFDKERLVSWLDTEAGSQDPNYFFGSLKGNLELQQIPLEYVNLLNFFKSTNIKTYLELGVGNGGSFFLNSLFLGNKCEVFHAVDSIAYAHTHIKQTEEKILKKVNLLSSLFDKSDIKFTNSLTDNFFKVNKNKYDCIFIDADHSYEGVKSDYVNSLNALNKNGIIVFHDIANVSTGVHRLWNEVKLTASRVEEYVWKPQQYNTYNCGIGIYFT